MRRILTTAALCASTCALLFFLCARLHAATYASLSDSVTARVTFVTSSCAPGPSRTQPPRKPRRRAPRRRVGRTSVGSDGR